MSYKLEQPYTDEKRTEFITEYGQDCWQRRGYIMRIVETNTALYALEPDEIMGTDETGEAVPVKNSNYKAEQAEKARQARITEIKAELNELDTKRIRAMCEPSVYSVDTGETWLDYYNSQARGLREELQTLEADKW